MTALTDKCCDSRPNNKAYTSRGEIYNFYHSNKVAIDMQAEPFLAKATEDPRELAAAMAGFMHY